MLYTTRSNNHNDINPTVRIQIQANTGENKSQTETGGLRCSRTNGLLITWLRFFDTRRETRFLKVFRNHTTLTTPQVSHISLCFRSQFIFAGRHPENLTTAATVENLIQWQRTQFSAQIAETQLSACIVQSRILNCWVFQNPQILSPSLLGLTSSSLQPHF